MGNSSIKFIRKRKQVRIIMSSGECETEERLAKVKKIIENSDRAYLTSLLTNGGVRTGKIGFELVKCTILLYRYFDGCLEHAYEALSELFKINKLAVEKDVRMAIREAKQQGEKYLSLNALAGYKLFPEDKDMMTPKEFIAIMSECVYNEALRESLLNKSAN